MIQSYTFEVTMSKQRFYVVMMMMMMMMMMMRMMIFHHCTVLGSFACVLEISPNFMKNLFHGILFYNSVTASIRYAIQETNKKRS